MNIFICSLVMSVLWSDIFIILSILCTRWNRFIRCNISSVIILMTVSIFRLVFTFDLPFAKVIRSEHIYPPIFDFLRKDIIWIKSLGINITCISAFLLVWLVVGIGLMIQFSIRFKNNSQKVADLPAKRDFYAEEMLQSIANRKDNGKILVYRSHVKIPFLHGVFKPKIFLPEYDFSESELNGILCHEYNHYLHKDILIKILVKCFCIIFWWNPMVYLLKANLNHTLEIKCDINLISNLSAKARISYLDSIMRIVKLDKNSISKVADGSAGLVSVEGKKLEQRFKVVLEYDKPDWKSRLSKSFFYMIMISLLIISFLFILQPYKGSYPLMYETDVSGINYGLDDGWIYSGYEVNSYLKENEDGTYSVYIDGKFNRVLDDISNNDLENLPIIRNEE